MRIVRTWMRIGRQRLDRLLGAGPANDARDQPWSPRRALRSMEPDGPGPLAEHGEAPPDRNGLAGDRLSRPSAIADARAIRMPCGRVPWKRSSPAASMRAFSSPNRAGLVQKNSVSLTPASISIGLAAAQICQSALSSFQVTASKSFQLVSLISSAFCAA